MSEDAGDSNEKDLFPEARCLSVFSELSAWTSVGDCLAAARFLEGRFLPDDKPAIQLIVPFPDEGAYEAVFIRFMDWLIRSFLVPASKVQLAALLDQVASAATWSTVAQVRFKPTIKAGPAGGLRHRDERLAADRFLLVTDQAHVIELVRTPINCLKDLLDRAWSTASELRAMRKRAADATGGAPTIFHQPYADGPLYALIEAVAFYVHGLDLGSGTLLEHRGLNRGFRSFEVVGVLPVDQTLFQIAQQAMRQILRQGGESE